MTIIEGDCVEVMREMAAASVDAVCTDPPYFLSFMGRAWDTVAASEMQRRHETWAVEALRVLKPGGHLLAFGGTRTYHRLVCGIEDAGFEIRDTIAWMYGSGFPKSLDVSKAIDKAAGAERDRPIHTGFSPFGGPGVQACSVCGRSKGGAAGNCRCPKNGAPATPDAEQWSGWGTALKPSFEPIVVARKPLAGTVSANVLAHGTGALNVDGCRIGFSDNEPYDIDTKCRPHSRGESRGEGTVSYVADEAQVNVSAAGRWPANVVLDPEAAALLDAQTGTLTSGKVGPEGYSGPYSAGVFGRYAENRIDPATVYGDSGGASRFFATFSACGNESIEGVPTFDGGNPVAARSTPSSSTDGSGSRPTDPSQTDTTSTIRTPTPSTTISPTSNSSHGPNTRLSTEPSEPPRLNVTGSDTAPAASSGSPSTNSPSDPAGSDRGTASPASASTCGSGAPGTETSTPRICVPIEQGGAERFRYCAKTSSAERNAGLDGFETRANVVLRGNTLSDPRMDSPQERRPQANVHPTVKPIALMRWLVRLITPPGGTVLDPFAGSGTTGCAAALEGFKFVGIEREPEYAAIARARIAWWATHPEGMVLVERLAAEQAQRDYAESGQLNLLADTR